MVDKTREYVKDMGETGAGMTTAEMMRAHPGLANRWGAPICLTLNVASPERSSEVIEAKTPWFFEVRALISERPSLCPAGIGNNNTEIDTSLLLPSDDAVQTSAAIDAEIDAFEGQSASSGWDDSVDPAVGNEQDELTSDVTPYNSGTEKIIPVKRKHEVPPTADGKKTSARPGISAPAAVRDTSKRPKSTTDRFADIAKLEEETAQREIDLKKVKAKGATEVKIVKLNAQARTKIEKERLKAALATKKLEQDFQIRMAELQHRQASSSSLYNNPHIPNNNNSGYSNSNTWSFGHRNYPSQSSGFPSFDAQMSTNSGSSNYSDDAQSFPSAAATPFRMEELDGLAPDADATGSATVLDSNKSVEDDDLYF